MEVNLYAKLRQWAWGVGLLSATTLGSTDALVRPVSADDSSVVFVSDDKPSAVAADSRVGSGSVVFVGDLSENSSETRHQSSAPARLRQAQTTTPSRVTLFSSQAPARQSPADVQQLPRPSLLSQGAGRSGSSKPTLFSKPSQHNNSGNSLVAERRPASTAQKVEREPAERVEPLRVQPPEPQPSAVAATARATPTAGKGTRSQTQPQTRTQPQSQVAGTVEIDEVARRLIEVNERAQRATTVSDFTQIIGLCAGAIRAGASGENKQYAASTISWALNRRGQLHSEAGRPDEADTDFHAALEFNPNNWRALHNRAVSYAEARQFAEAFDDFNRVLELSPSYSKAYTNRATLFVQAGDLDGAKLDYQKACELDDTLISARIGLGRVCHLLGEWEEAIDHFTVAMQLDTDNPAVVCSRGDLYADMGRYGEALGDYARAIEIDPDYAHAYRNGAWLLATCPDERFRDAENALLGAQQALEFEYGDRHIALDTLAAAWAAIGEYDQAVQTMAQAIAEAPVPARAEYQERIRLYQGGQAYRSEPVREVAHATYEVSDR